jgi:PII-like signaling protein
MHGFQLTFFTQQDCRHGHTPLAEWLLLEARQLGLSGGTLTMAGEGFGRGGKLHSAHFFELADQPVEVTIAASAADAERLFQRLRDEQIKIFYVKTPIEFGMTGSV